MRPVSIYIHVPFCKRRCSYCTFYHIPLVDDLEEAFVDALLIEFKNVLDELKDEIYCPTIFFGGGTPSVLSHKSHARIFAALDPLVRGGQTEITMETNPEDVDGALVERLEALGVNRISMGIQSMDDGSLSILKRCTATKNEAAIAKIRERFDNFNVDVLLGIPDGSPARVADTLRVLTRYTPAHFSIYCLEPGGVMESEVGDFFDRVDSDQSSEEYLLVCDEMRKGGYHHYEVSNFALPGRECRHNLVYWQHGEFLGLGPGAHSFVGGRRFSNAPSLSRYVGDQGSVRVVDNRSSYERNTETLMLGLRTSSGVDIDRIGGDPQIVRELVEDGFATIEGSRLVLTDEGFLVLNEILLRLIRAA